MKASPDVQAAPKRPSLLKRLLLSITKRTDAG
jgi:hypothetical protein